MHRLLKHRRTPSWKGGGDEVVPRTFQVGDFEVEHVDLGTVILVGEIELAMVGDFRVDDGFFDITFRSEGGEGTASGTRGVETADFLPALDGGEAFFH